MPKAQMIISGLLLQNAKGNIWLADRQGSGMPGHGLCISATDMAKIGRLCLNQGMWEGNRILSKEWIG